MHDDMKKKIRDYLHNHSLARPLTLGNNKLLSFHWANDELASNYVKSLYTEEGEVETQRRVELEKELDLLENTPVWLMSRHGRIKSDLYNLYQCYLDPRLRNQWFELENIQVSTNHEAGPFQTLKSMRWFDKDVYARFIYLKMIKEWVPQRNFRLSLDIPIEIRAGGSPFHATPAKLHQITASGIVLHIPNCAKVKAWRDYPEIYFLKRELSLVKEHHVDASLSSHEWIQSLENFLISGKEFYQLVCESSAEQGDLEQFVFIPLSKIQMLSVKGHTHSLENLKDIFNEAQSTLHKLINAA